MCARQCVIFDLDGTLTQSEEGIWNCVRYAAESLGFPEPDAATLRKFVGPPLSYSFREYLHMSDEVADAAVAKYRERYSVVGLFENRVYPGIRRLLSMLKKQGAYVAVATGKPQVYAERIVAHFGLDKWFDKVVGPGMHAGADKDGLIRAALPEEWDRSWDNCWMIGDTRFDVEGGNRVGVKTLGVAYGYGTEKELVTAGATAICRSVKEVIDLLCPGTENPQGMFLSMEGLDGSGKTTQMNLLEDGLSRWGYEVVRSREPGGSRVGEKIRDILLDAANMGMAAETEALLFAASRAQHVREVIRPAVAAGKVLLCDRFVDSSVAYQGGGRELGVQYVLDINAPAVDGTMPLCTVYLNVDHKTALARRSAASELDRLEMEEDSFHARIEAAYQELIARDPERFVVVDATKSPEEIGRAALEMVLARLSEVEK